MKDTGSATHTKSSASVLVVIPTLGQRLDLLDQTLASITEQDYLHKASLVVCPRKNTAARKLAKKYGSLVADDPGSLSGAINVGIQVAKSEGYQYMAWMGDDDLLRPGSLATTTNMLNKNPGAVVAYGYCDYINDDGEVVFVSKAGKLAPWIMRWGPNLLPLPGMLFRVQSLLKTSGYDADLKYAMDLDVLLQLRPLGRFVSTNKVVGAFRWHSTSTTVANRRASLAEAEAVKRRYLARPLLFIAPLWEAPVRVATHIAASKVTKRAKEMA